MYRHLFFNVFFFVGCNIKDFAIILGVIKEENIKKNVNQMLYQLTDN